MKTAKEMLTVVLVMVGAILMCFLMAVLWVICVVIAPVMFLHKIKPSYRQYDSVLPAGRPYTAPSKRLPVKHKSRITQYLSPTE